MNQTSERPTDDELPPGTVGQNFWCRKQKWALNVMVIGDGHHLIRAVDTRWPGVTHDSRVWRNSHAKVIIESQVRIPVINEIRDESNLFQ